jgi:small basic protein
MLAIAIIPDQGHAMKNLRTRLSIGHRVLVMFFTWLVLGALIGVIEGLAMGGGLQIVCMMIGGMAVLPNGTVIRRKSLRQVDLDKNRPPSNKHGCWT